MQEAWFGLPKRFPTVALCELVVMPNHLHAIVGLTRPIQPLKAGAASGAPTGKTSGLAYPVLGDVIRAFKSISAIEINRILGRRGEAVWQRNYHEHSIRNLEEFQRIREYILENPSHWHDDPENVGLWGRCLLRPLSATRPDSPNPRRMLCLPTPGVGAIRTDVALSAA
ncbi:MAG TPA: transposase [Candidatus Acidoferrales bacterium]|nr:transposase [Candidatus Acidoferrales bacterium]